MRLSQKKNCENCRAAATLTTGSGNGKCELGFNNRGPYIKALGIYRMVPQEPCYKPKSYDELLQAIEIVRQGTCECGCGEKSHNVAEVGLSTFKPCSIHADCEDFTLAQ